MMTRYSVRISELRKLLFSAFSESDLIALCQDEFYEVYQKLGVGRGLTKDEIINIIIDYFQRRGDFSSLLSAIKTRSPQLYEEREEKLISYAKSDASREIISSSGLIRKEDWGESIDTGVFLGRNTELDHLSHWVINDRCRVVALLGMGGIGKSSLAVRLIESIKGDFDYLFWRDLRNAPPIEGLLDDAIKFFSDQQKAEDIPANIDTKISLLIECFRNARCLFVLDNAEAILQSGDKIGHYRDGYEAYGTLLQRVGGSLHKSCMFITSREKPREISILEGKSSSVRAIQLTGLDSEAAQKLLSEYNLHGSVDDWQSLFKLYGGNPLALKISSVYIEDWYEGNIDKFLIDDVAVFGEIEDLLEQQLKRLPDQTKEIMYWLAIERGAISLSQLEKEVLRWLVIQRTQTSITELLEDIITPITREELVSTLDSLKRMSLIEKTDSRYTLQPVIMEYLTKQFVKLIFVEISTELPRLLRTHALIQAQAKEHVMRSQIRFILQPLVKRIQTLYSMNVIEKKLNNILDQVRNQTRLVPGYVGGNIINLLNEMAVDLTGWDFSRLSIWQANLREMPLHNVDFSYSDVRDSIFAETFDLILAVANSPSGDLIAAGSASGDVYIWQISENRQVQVLKGHTNWVRAVTFSPDNKFLATGSGDHTVKIWDLSRNECINTLNGHTDWIRSLSFSKDGRYLASGASDKRVKIWKVNDGSLLKDLNGHSDWVWSVCFDQSGRLIASGGNDNSARIWDVESGECLSILEHPDWVRSVSFDNSGAMLASGCNDGVVRIWDWSNKTIHHELLGHSDRIWCVAFNHTGNVLASSSFDKTIRLWDAKNGYPIKTLQGHTGWVISISYSQDDSTLVSGSEDQTVRIWDAQTGECLRIFKGHTNCFQSVDLLRQENQIVTGSTDQTVRVWNLYTGECVRVFKGHTNRIQSVAISKDGKYLASGGDDQTIRIWDLENGQFPKVLKGHTSWIRSVAISPNCKHVASGCDDLNVGLWDIQNGQLIRFLKGHKGFVATVAFHPDSNILASGSADTKIKIWNVNTGEQINELSGHKLRINDLAFSPDGKYVSSVSDDGKISIWEWSRNKVEDIIDGHNGPIKFVAFSEDNRLLISGGDDQILKLWGVEKMNLIKEFPGHTSRIWDGVFTLDNNRIVTVSEDETIRVWNIGEGTCEKVLTSKNLYDGLSIIGVRNLTDVQRTSLKLLGAKDS